MPASAPGCSPTSSGRFASLTRPSQRNNSSLAVSYSKASDLFADRSQFILHSITRWDTSRPVRLAADRVDSSQNKLRLEFQSRHRSATALSNTRRWICKCVNFSITPKWSKKNATSQHPFSIHIELQPSRPQPLHQLFAITTGVDFRPCLRCFIWKVSDADFLVTHSLLDQFLVSLKLQFVLPSQHSETFDDHSHGFDDRSPPPSPSRRIAKHL